MQSDLCRIYRDRQERIILCRAPDMSPAPELWIACRGHRDGVKPVRLFEKRLAAISTVKCADADFEKQVAKRSRGQGNAHRIEQLADLRTHLGYRLTNDSGQGLWRCNSICLYTSDSLIVAIVTE